MSFQKSIDSNNNPRGATPIGGDGADPQGGVISDTYTTNGTINTSNANNTFVNSKFCLPNDKDATVFFLAVFGFIFCLYLYIRTKQLFDKTIRKENDSINNIFSLENLFTMPLVFISFLYFYLKALNRIEYYNPKLYYTYFELYFQSQLYFPHYFTNAYLIASIFPLLIVFYMSFRIIAVANSDISKTDKKIAAFSLIFSFSNLAAIVAFFANILKIIDFFRK